MKGIRFLFFLLGGVLFLGCSKKGKASDKDLQEKIYRAKGNGWKSKVAFHSFKGMNYRATQVPIQYYFLKNESTNLKNVDSLYQINKLERVMEFEFSNTNKDDVLKDKYTKRNYTKSVEYMAFHIEKDFEVVTSSGDTIACSGVTFERNFKLAPFKRVLLFFSGIPENDNIKLIYEDKLYGNGLFKFGFNEVPIKL